MSQIRAAIYVRVSTKDQAALRGQRERTRAYCEQRGYRVVGHYGPGDFCRLLDAAVAGKVDVVVSDGRERLSRDRVHGNGTRVFNPVQRLEEAGVRVEEAARADQGLDADLPIVVERPRG
jgi:DNA invertase Pin-like site-specific DNA recombinase